MTRPPPRSTLLPYTTLFRSDEKSREFGPVQVFSPGLAPQVSPPTRGRPVAAGSFAHPRARRRCAVQRLRPGVQTGRGDRKSTRLNSSHLVISYAVFCLTKEK